MFLNWNRIIPFALSPHLSQLKPLPPPSIWSPLYCWFYLLHIYVWVDTNTDRDPFESCFCWWYVYGFKADHSEAITESHSGTQCKYQQMVCQCQWRHDSCISISESTLQKRRLKGCSSYSTRKSTMKLSHPC